MHGAATLPFAGAILDRFMQRNYHFTLASDSLSAERQRTYKKEKNMPQRGCCN